MLKLTRSAFGFQIFQFFQILSYRTLADVVDTLVAVALDVVTQHVFLSLSRLL